MRLVRRRKTPCFPLVAKDLRFSFVRHTKQPKTARAIGSVALKLAERRSRKTSPLRMLAATLT